MIKQHQETKSLQSGVWCFFFVFHTCYFYWFAIYLFPTQLVSWNLTRGGEGMKKSSHKDRSIENLGLVGVYSH